MRIREFQAGDMEKLKAMHAKQGFRYPFPDIQDESFLMRTVLEDDSGEPVMGALARLTAEVYLLVDPDAGTPAEKMHRIMALQAVAMPEAWRRGLDDLHCWLPPSIERSFGRRMAAMGWRKVSWPCYWKQLGMTGQKRAEK